MGRLRETGGVLVELALVLPLLFIFVVGMLELGILLNQVHWFVQVAYQTAYVGSESPESVRVGRMTDAYNQLQEVNNERWRRLPMTINPLIEARTGTSGEDRNLIRATVSGNLSANRMIRLLPLRVTMSTPVLLRGELPASALDDFENPSRVYDCCGQRCEPPLVCPPTVCVVCASTDVCAVPGCGFEVIE